MATGIIKKKLNGFGFIQPDEGGEDFFFHADGLNGVDFNSLQEGAKVQFDAGSGPKGPKAENITLAA